MLFRALSAVRVNSAVELCLYRDLAGRGESLKGSFLGRPGRLRSLDGTDDPTIEDFETLVPQELLPKAQ